jgi:hypothetical protein
VHCPLLSIRFAHPCQATKCGVPLVSPEYVSPIAIHSSYGSGSSTGFVGEKREREGNSAAKGA